MLKKIIAIGAVLLVAVFFFAFRDDRAITNYPSSNTGGVVAFGDSLVEGVGSTGGGFVKVLSTDLDVPIANLGRSGDTTADALKRVSDVTRRKPELTIVLLGGNDYLRRLPTEQTLSNLEKIIEAIQESGSAVLLVGVEADFLGGNHSEVFESLAEKYGTAYVPDILDGIINKRVLMSDSIHPNDLGYRVFAERILPVLEEILPQD